MTDKQMFVLAGIVFLAPHLPRHFAYVLAATYFILSVFWG
jgi:hypothetical protein